MFWDHVPAFFSWRVSSAQLPFMRSRRAIHSSACSVWGMPSHRFSMLARVGLEMACVEAAARWIRTGEARAPARRSDETWVRIMMADWRAGRRESEWRLRAELKSVEGRGRAEDDGDDGGRAVRSDRGRWWCNGFRLGGGLVGG